MTVERVLEVRPYRVLSAAVIDSFDAVEQVLGHALDVHGGHPPRDNRAAV